MKTCLNCKTEYQDGIPKCTNCGSTSARLHDGSLSEGSVIAGRYQICRKLSNSGSVLSYEATDRLFGGKVIVREYAPLPNGNSNLAADNSLFAAGCEIFTARMRYAARYIDGVCSDIIRANGTVYAVRPYIDGAALKELVADGIKDDSAKYMIMQKLTDQLLTMKEQNSSHGAISPDNVIIKDEGSVILTDPAAPMIRDSSLCYPVNSDYSAPELKDGCGITFESDAYSLFAVCCYILTGSAPIIGADVKKSIPSDTGLGMIIESGLSINPSSRSRAVAELSQKLASLTGVQNNASNIEGDLATVEIAAKDLSISSPTTEVKQALKKKLTARGGAVIAAALLLIVCGGIFASIKIAEKIREKGDSSITSSEELRIPDLSGLSLESAEEEATALGLRVSAKDKTFSNEVAENMIMLQEPQNGSLCKKGDVIYVTISAGKEMKIFDVISYIGMPFDEAKKELEGYGVTVERIDDDKSVLLKGAVCRQIPAAGNVLKSGDKVTLYVSAKDSSTYDKNAFYSVPDFTGINESYISSVEGSGYFKISVVHEYSSQYEINTVYAQSIDPGNTAQVDSELILYVSRGAETAIVPDTQFKSNSTAQDMLENAGFTPSVSYAYSNSVEEGHVISQSVASGTAAEIGTVITIVVSNGPEKKPQPQTETEEKEERKETEQKVEETAAIEVETTNSSENTATMVNGETPPQDINDEGSDNEDENKKNEMDAIENMLKADT